MCISVRTHGGCDICGATMDRRNFCSGITGLVLNGIMIQVNGEKTTRGPVFVEAGRRVDARDSTAVRFPSQNVTKVRKRIRQVFTQRLPVATVSSAACGADLLLLDVAMELRVPSHILLPTEPENFRVSSVTDRPGNWGEIYSKALRTSTVEVLNLPQGQAGYLETNLQLLDRAQSLADKEHTTVHALIVWNKESRGPEDVTAHFLEQAELRKVPVLQISTL
jgi:hypothetical protein